MLCTGRSILTSCCLSAAHNTAWTWTWLHSWVDSQFAEHPFVFCPVPRWAQEMLVLRICEISVRLRPQVFSQIPSVCSRLVPSAFLYVMRHRGLQPELEPFPTREGSLCFPEGPFQTTLITESMAQPALQHPSDPAVSGFTMA